MQLPRLCHAAQCVSGLPAALRVSGLSAAWMGVRWGKRGKRHHGRTAPATAPVTLSMLSARRPSAAALRAAALPTAPPADTDGDLRASAATALGDGSRMGGSDGCRVGGSGGSGRVGDAAAT
eukprot:288822-Chlamydomonas_euryale.AAC.3